MNRKTVTILWAAVSPFYLVFLYRSTGYLLGENSDASASAVAFLGMSGLTVAIMSMTWEWYK